MDINTDNKKEETGSSKEPDRATPRNMDKHKFNLGPPKTNNRPGSL
jgi:hypothetical protein